MKKNNKIPYIGAAVLCVALIAASVGINAEPQVNFENEVKIVEGNATPISESLEATGVLEYEKIRHVMALDVQVTSAEEDEYEPAIGIDPDQEYLLAYTFEEDFTENRIIWTFSTDEGQTWDPGVYYPDIIGVESHSAISYRGSEKKFTGTFAGDYIEGNGAIQYYFRCDDPTDPDTYTLSFIDWSSSFPYSDRRIPDCGGYVLPDKAWWYGIQACVGTRDVRVDMPIFNYANYEEEGRGWSSYFSGYQGCENAALDVDLTNGYFYATFDYLDGSDWDILLMRGDCNGDGGTPQEHPLWFTSAIIGDTENTTYPAVGANEDYVIIVAQTNEAGNEDIVCYYSDDAGDTFQMSYVADSGADELYPSIVVYGAGATCTFIMDGDLYNSKTTDGGENWSPPEQVNDEDGTVESEFRNTDITTDGTVVWADNFNGNLDIFLDNVGEIGDPPGAPSITGPNGGKVGTSYEFQFNAVDPDGNNVRYIIDWGDTTSNTTGYGPHNTDLPFSHTWTLEDTYTIKAKAQDINGIGPEATKTVNMPRNKAVHTQLFLQYLQNHPNLFPILRHILGL